MYHFEWIDGQACTQWREVYAEMEKKGKGYFEVFDEEKYISYRQIKWWKGVLLKELSEYNGESKDEWETRLKFNVMPDKFVPKGVIYNKTAYNLVPSIKTLSVKQMNYMIKESVLWLREGKNGPHLDWVTEPDSSLRKLIGL